MLVPRRDDAVKNELCSVLRTGVDDLINAVDGGASPRKLEERCWSVLVGLGRDVMGFCLAFACRRATEEDLEARGIAPEMVQLRVDEDYWATSTTTFGPVRFPWFAYRDRSSGVAVVTRVPARQRVLPLHRRCRSSELLLEWETRLGSDHPFRHAQQALSYFTHDAVQLEDTTIARHMVKVSGLVDRGWTYRCPDEIAEILRTRATRDKETGRPLLYASTDAHALRTYVDETWDAQWKMANGVRLWCVDRHSGATIHIGGEYTWGDCKQVASVFQWLRDTGRMPAGGRYADGVNAQLVLVTDGAQWIKDHVAPLFPTAVLILDAYHVMEHLSDYAAARFGRGTMRASSWYQKALNAMFGKSKPKRAKASKPRSGHNKRTNNHEAPPPMPPDDAPHAELRDRAPAAGRLIALIHTGRVPKRCHDKHDTLIGYIDGNAARIDYERWRPRGYQIGSGAMESLHRTASQVPLKIPGARWLPETSQAIFNLRMLRLCGRWDEFWAQPALTSALVGAFRKPTPANQNAHQQAA